MRTLVLATLLLLAGCSSPSPTDDATLPAGGERVDPDVPQVPGGALVEHAVALDGHLGPGACVPAGVNSCMVGSVADDAWVFVEEPRAALWNVSLLLEWEATSAFDEELSVDVLRFARDGGTTVGYGLASAQGTSPLELQATGLETTPGEDEGLWLQVDRIADLPSPLYGYAGLEQPFHLEGSALAHLAG